MTIADSIQDQTYKKALEFTSKFQENPVGLSQFIATGQVDKIFIRQNNTIIVLLIEINQKLEKIIKEKELEQHNNSGLEEIITLLSY